MAARPRIPLSSLSFLGQGLNRPECVLAHSSGLLLVSDWTGNGGVALLSPEGAVRRVLARDDQPQLRPNGIALEPGGTLLLAHLGADEGGVFRLYADGTTEPLLTEVDGRALPPTNFVLRQDDARLWITISTAMRPRSAAYRKDVADGFVILLEGGRARIAAEGLGYTNECLVSPEGGTLFVNETFARRTRAFAIGRDGQLGPAREVARYGEGCFPDGLAMDRDGGLWVTSIVSNRVVHVATNGRQEVMLEDSDPDHLDWVEEAYRAHAMGRPHLDKISSRRLANISSLAFGGPDLSTAYLGCLLGDRLACFAAPRPGLPPPHWTTDLGPLPNLFSEAAK